VVAAAVAETATKTLTASRTRRPLIGGLPLFVDRSLHWEAEFTVPSVLVQHHPPLERLSWPNQRRRAPGAQRFAFTWLVRQGQTGRPVHRRRRWRCGLGSSSWRCQDGWWHHGPRPGSDRQRGRGPGVVRPATHAGCSGSGAPRRRRSGSSIQNSLSTVSTRARPLVDS
jgi:hypothetical protein